MSEALSGIDLSGITDGILEGAKVGIPAVIGILGIRKGLSFLIGLIRSA